MSQFFRIHPDNPQPRLIKQAVEIVSKGGVIAMPTDSSSHASDVRMPLSSSTMYTIGAGDVVIAGVSLNIGMGIARAARKASGRCVARVVRWGCAAHHNEPKTR